MSETERRGSGFDDHMSASDAVLWDIEKDPVLRSTITAVAVLDRAPDWDRLVERMELASRSIPRLRQRVVVPPLRVGPPRWVVDPQFDLAYHLRRVRAPEPATLRTVLDLAQPIAMIGFDRARPLWEFTLVEGLADGRAALIEKLHHSLADGVGAIELALMMLDETRQGDDRGAMPALPAPGPAAPAVVFRDAVEERMAQVTGSLVNAPRTVGSAAVSTLRDPLGSVGRAAELSRSIAKLLTPVTEPASPIMRGRSLSRRFDTLEVQLADLKAAGHAAGGTLNDAFLAAVVGGVGRYHGLHGATLDTLRITMPVNYRGAGDSMGGNRFAPARFAVPAAIADPVERMQQVGAIAHAWQREPALAYSDAVAGVLDRLPVSVTTSIFGGMLKNIDLVCTNVPGLPSRSYLAGAEVERQYAFAPPSGASLSVALLSHVETACVGLVVDTAAVPDHEALMACLVGAFDEVLAVSGHGVVRTA
jgi:WS/DGAT/MGAT family acyltransferase